MLARLAWALAAALALPSCALATAEEDVATAIRGRLEAVRRNDIDAWAGFAADDMMAPLPESATTCFVPGEVAGGDSSRIVFVKKIH